MTYLLTKRISRGVVEKFQDSDRRIFGEVVSRTTSHSERAINQEHFIFRAGCNPEGFRTADLAPWNHFFSCVVSGPNARAMSCISDYTIKNKSILTNYGSSHSCSIQSKVQRKLVLVVHIGYCNLPIIKFPDFEFYGSSVKQLFFGKRQPWKEL
jgi:hypothetical protein